MCSTNNNRVIIIDDNEAIHDDFRKTLTPYGPDQEIDDLESELFGDDKPNRGPVMTFEIDTANQGQIGFERVKQAKNEGNPYAVAFVDMRMPPGWDGLTTIQNLWQTDPDLQVVICSAFSDYSWEEIVRKLGVRDQLVILKKPFDTAEVSQLAMSLTRKWSLNQQAKLKLEQLEELVKTRTVELHTAATHDALTGLPNRSEFHHTLKQAIERCQNESDGCCVFFIDFDRFKLVNDSLGHEAGDALLIQIAKRLKKVIADYNGLCGRLGGDEFVVLVESCKPLDNTEQLDKTEQLASQLLDVLRQPYEIFGHTVYSTPSIGIKRITGEQAGSKASAEDMIRDADAAMYQAKASGRDCVVCFDQSMHEQSMERMKIEVDLRQAIEQDQIQVAYQPLVCCTNGQLTGFEALARWQHPTRGWISPAKFIPVAEETGLIAHIGFKILDTAVEQFVRWRQEGGAIQPGSINVNLSKRQILLPDIEDEIQLVIDRHGIEPEMLVLEVTESVVTGTDEVIQPVLNRIKKLGVRLALDDFGTGTSSLTALHKLPIDVLKIDRSFITPLEDNVVFTATLHAIVTLAKNLGMKVTAEGIETQGQLLQVQSLDVDYGQGYWFAKPMLAQEVATACNCPSALVA